MVPSASWEIFSEFLTFCNEIIAKYEKRGKYLTILHEATCDNYFIVKYLLKSNVARIILLTKSSFALYLHMYVLGSYKNKHILFPA